MVDRWVNGTMQIQDRKVKLAEKIYSWVASLLNPRIKFSTRTENRSDARASSKSSAKIENISDV
jgi:hypothetical protein